MSQVLLLEDFMRWKVPPLKEFLRKRGLGYSKNKAELAALCFAANKFNLPLELSATDIQKEKALDYDIQRSEYSAFWKCVQAGALYMLTQLCKMIILATFFPTSDVTNDSLDVVGEFLKSSVDLADLVGIHLIMTNIPGKGQLKFLVAGVGWATAELVMTRFWPLWVGARGIEFDWRYIQMSFDSNVSLLQHISTAALVWLYSRTDLQKSLVPVVMTLLALSCYRPLIVEILIHAVGLGSWTLLLAKALFTGCVGLIALQIYLGLSVSKEVNSYY